MPKMLDEQMLAEQLLVSASTLRNWRYEGTGPKFLKVGGAVRYREDDVAAWLDAQTRGGRTEAGSGGRDGQ